MTTFLVAEINSCYPQTKPWTLYYLNAKSALAIHFVPQCKRRPLLEVLAALTPALPVGIVGTRSAMRGESPHSSKASLTLSLSCALSRNSTVMAPWQLKVNP